VTFYAWVAALLAFNLFPRRLDIIVAIWLAVTFLNELTIDAVWVEKIFMVDYSGYFATGLMLSELHKGRRDLRMQALLALSAGCSVFLAIHKLEWLREYSQARFDDAVVAAIVMISVAALLLSTKVERLPFRPGLVLAIGGVTYPFYLLHQQIGYDLLQAIDVTPTVGIVAAVLAVVLLMSWALWRWFERAFQSWAHRALHASLATLALHRRLWSCP
jgi:peptidoglycan/LPS O-acetylase OafA/YrhL